MILENIKKEEIKKLYESHGIFLLQEGIGDFFRKISGIALKNEDDIFRAFKTNADGFGLSFIDDIVTKSTSTKNLQDIENLQRQLMHSFNPSGLSENVPSAMEKTKKILNGYAKSKGKNNFQEIKDEIVGKINKNQTSQQQYGGQTGQQQYGGQTGQQQYGGQTGQQQYGGQSNQQYKNNDHAKFYEKQKGTITGTSWFSDKRISNRTIDSIMSKIDWSKITNKGNGKTSQEFTAYYNNLIAKAIKTKDFQSISRGGFEELGISNFREFLQNNISQIVEVIPETGRWSVYFK
jgi:hypothetical protein